MAAVPTRPGPVGFLDFLRARGGFTTEDVLATLLPLFRQVQETHSAGRVAPLEGVGALLVDDYRVYFEVSHAGEPRLVPDRIRAIESREGAFEVVGRRIQTTEADAGEETHENLLVAKPGTPVERPVYLPGYVGWEHQVGHHDALTDIYVLGLVLASVACGLDVGDRGHLEAFVARRRNLFGLTPHLNPVVAKNIQRMTELDRHRRAQDLGAIIRSLETYREQDVGLELDLSQIPGFHDSDAKSRRHLVIARLRERLFELSRRNRLLYYKPTLQSLNLTFASVPILFDTRSIRPEQLFTWQPEVEKLLADGTPIPLTRYLRFEDAPYLPSVLDKLISEARRDTAEFGFSQLRLVLCFLRWNNLKENAQERIDSPLLLLPVDLTKRKGVRDSYVMRATSREAEVNPILRYYLKQIYNLNLPHSIDLGETTLQAFFDTLVSQIHATEPGVALNRLERPQIEMVYARARRRLDQYRRRMPLPAAGLKSFRDLDYSYKRDRYQPLGLRLFIGAVRPSPAPLHDLFRERPVRQALHMVGSSPAARDPGEKEKTIAAFRDGTYDGNPYSWDFDLCSLTLGNFNYRKMSLVRDYNTLLEQDQPSPSFDAVFSDTPRSTELPTPSQDGGLAGRFPVVPCDPTQLKAIAAAESGQSYIVQGPPGTGKSQTITNLIADLVARGKRVLFVCEKRAAIDVVYHRLRQRGLHDLVCLIHDSQADKRDFVLDLKNTYERLLASAGESPDRSSGRRQGCVEELEREARPLSRFHEAMRSTPAESGIGLRRLIVRVIELKERLTELSPEDEDELPPYRLWVENRETIERLDRALRMARPDGVYARHPLCSLSPSLASRERPRAGLEDDLRNMVRLLDHVEAVAREHGVALGSEDTLGRAALWVRYAATVKPLADRSLLGLLDPDSDASQELRRRVRDRQQQAEALARASAETRAWRQKLEPGDLTAALEQARAIGSGLFRFLKPGFWELRRVLESRYDFKQHAIRPTWVRILEGLRAEYACAEALERSDAQARAEYGTESLDALAAELDGVRRAVGELIGSSPEMQRERLLSGVSRRTILGLVSLRDVLAELERLAASLFVDPSDWTLSALRAERAKLVESLRLLPDWLPCLAEAAALPDRLARAIRTLPLDLAQLEAAVAATTLNGVWHRERGLARFTGSTRARQVQRLEALHGQWLEVNAEFVIEQNRARFLDKVARASVPSIRLSKEQEAFKRQYNLGRRELEHEFGKTMRYKSVRALLAGPAGEVILDLKPVWLMSPLSVSDTLPIDSRAFDAVVFDEASQVPLEEAVPALFRADQVIVSGDQMQLPPTNFFSATRSTGDDVLLVEDEEGEGPVEYELDANSFLAHAARNLPSTMLGWHYRSRSESLISFSNAAFYGGRLLTVPERQALRSGLGEICAASPEEDGRANVDRVLDRPVSFHLMERSVYEARRNGAEAVYIAQLVRGLVTSASRPTIGIVAFSEAQQGEIEAAIERLGARDPAFQARLEEEYEREEDGQFAGLLVKNLENIQGDERDVIVLSVCYGYGPDGRMLMNFGPINQGGGEKRLNVAFSRARKHMAVVSSIRYSDIKNVYNDGANSLRSYLHYAAAMSAGDLGLARFLLKNLNPLAPGASPEQVAEDTVVRELGLALRARGFEVDVALGHSHFRCDLAVKRPHEAAFTLAVFVDTEAHYRERDTLERDVLRPALLRSFGWSVAHVLAKDWFDDPEAVVAGLERALRGDVPEPVAEPAVGEVEPLSDRDVWLERGAATARPPAARTETTPSEPPTEPVAAAGPAPARLTDPLGPVAPSASVPPSAPPAAPASAARIPPPTPQRISQLLPGQTRYFEFIGGTSKKYWHVTVDGCELVVSFGRIGTAGQLKRKTFPSEALARHEAEALIREKIGKGYQEVQPG